MQHILNSNLDDYYRVTKSLNIIQLYEAITWCFNNTIEAWETINLTNEEKVKLGVDYCSDIAEKSCEEWKKEKGFILYNFHRNKKVRTYADEQKKYVGKFLFKNSKDAFNFKIFI